MITVIFKKIKLNKCNNELGIGLVEVVAALGLSVLVLTSLVSLSLFTLRSSLTSKLQLEGTKLANREMELVRAYRDSRTQWEAEEPGGFLDDVIGCTSSSPCHMEYSPSLAVANGTDIIGAGLEAITRYFYVTRVDGSSLMSGDQEVRVSVVVSWLIGDDEKFARLYTDLTNWENK